MMTLLLTLALGLQQPPPAADSAVVRVGARPVAVFRVSLGAATPQERAAAALRRIEAALEAGLDSVTVADAPTGPLLQLGGRPVFSVPPGDVDTVAGETLASQAAAVAAALQQAVREYRESRTFTALAWAAVLVLAATLVLITAFRLLRRAQAALTRRLDIVGARRLRDLGIGGFTLVRQEQLVRTARFALLAVVWAIGLLLIYAWTTFVLTRFPHTRAWGEALGGYLTTTAGNLFRAVLGAVPGLFAVVLIFIGARLATRLFVAVFTAAETGRITLPGIHPETAAPTRKVSIALLWLFALIIAYPYLPGSGTDAFKGVTVFAGLLLTLGSSGVVGQAMSGLVLMYARALRPGDYVRVGEVEGTVTEVGLLSTKIRSNKLEEITIPSAVVLGNTVQNYSRLAADRGVILHTEVTIGYDAPWRQVHALLLEAARRTSGLRPDPPPYVRQRSLSDFYVAYELNAYCDLPHRRRAVLSELHAHIQDAFNEHGVQIMSPHYEEDKRDPVVVPKEKWFAPPARPGVSPSDASLGEG